MPRELGEQLRLGIEVLADRLNDERRVLERGVRGCHGDVAVGHGRLEALAQLCDPRPGALGGLLRARAERDRIVARGRDRRGKAGGDCTTPNYSKPLRHALLPRLLRGAEPYKIEPDAVAASAQRKPVREGVGASGLPGRLPGSGWTL